MFAARCFHLSSATFPSILVASAGFEPATFALSERRSHQAELAGCGSGPPSRTGIVLDMNQAHGHSASPHLITGPGGTGAVGGLPLPAPRPDRPAKRAAGLVQCNIMYAIRVQSYSKREHQIVGEGPATALRLARVSAGGVSRYQGSHAAANQRRAYHKKQPPRRALRPFPGGAAPIAFRRSTSSLGQRLGTQDSSARPLLTSWIGESVAQSQGPRTQN